MPYLVDTNILLRMCDRSSPEHEVCRAAVTGLVRRGEPCHSCAQTLIEFWAVATRPRDVNGLGFTPTDTLSNLVDFQRSLPCLSEPPDIASRWQALVVQHEVRGRKAHDACLVAFMQAHQLSDILTLNTVDFARYSGIKPMTPEQVLASMT
jgi:predicted nucleic acid-binding protein